jgi:hypothetical protein
MQVSCNAVKIEEYLEVKVELKKIKNVKNSLYMIRITVLGPLKRGNKVILKDYLMLIKEFIDSK